MDKSDSSKKPTSGFKISDKIIARERLFGCLLILFCLCFFIWYKVVYSAKPSIPPRYCEPVYGWTYLTDSGIEVAVTPPYDTDSEPGVPVIFKTRLPDNIRNDYYFTYFTTRTSDVYIDGKLRYTFDPNNASTLPGGIAKRVFLFVDLNADDAGKELRLVNRDPSISNSLLMETYVGDSLGLVTHFFENDFIYFSFCIILLVISLVIIIVSLVYVLSYRRFFTLLPIGAATFLTALWLILDDSCFQFVFNDYFIDGTLSYMIGLLIPGPFLVYINEMQKKRNETVIFFLETGVSVSFIVFTVLNITDVLPFRNALPYIDLVLSLFAILGAFICIKDIVAGHLEEYKFVGIGFLILIILCLALLFGALANATWIVGYLLLVGAYVLLVSAMMQQVDDSIKRETTKQYAVEANEAKSLFLANMSHEIRTPINTILGINEMILREEKNRKIIEYSSMIKNSGKILLGLVNDVLDFSKIEAGKMEIVNATYDTAVFIHDLIEFLNENADKKGLSTHISVMPSIPIKLSGDEVHLRQVLVNLLSNAVKYTDDGHVAFTVTEYTDAFDNLHLKFEVADTGIGIKEDELNSLFEAFTRADIKKNRTIQGTGLGLAIVQMLSKAMGGTINVESEYGTGSVFTFDIPQIVIDRRAIGDSYINASYSEVKARAEVFKAPGVRVLAVDDTFSNLIILKEFLKDTGIILDLATSGKKALEYTHDNKYDLIFMDHMMPDPDGIVTMHQIRSDLENLNRETPIIVTTANAIAGSREFYIKEGFDEYLSKPIEMGELLKVTEGFIKKLFGGKSVSNSEKDTIGTQAAEASLENTQQTAAAQSAAGDSAPATQDATDNSTSTVSETSEYASESVITAIKNASDFMDALGQIPGVDVNLALEHMGNSDEILASVLEEMVSESKDRLFRMRQEISEKNFANYRVDAHSAKSNMAMVGMTTLSEHAKLHEYASRDENYDYVIEDYEKLLSEYEEVCSLFEIALSKR